jgi:hypothetical protein
MYLARISTARMKAHGNVSAAEALLALQVEWANVLHQYETHGVAFKTSRKEARSDLIALLKSRTLTENPRERAAVSRLIAEAFAELGQPLQAEAQKDLPGV